VWEGAASTSPGIVACIWRAAWAGRRPPKHSGAAADLADGAWGSGQVSQVALWPVHGVHSSGAAALVHRLLGILRCLTAAAPGPENRVRPSLPELGRVQANGCYPHSSVPHHRPYVLSVRRPSSTSTSSRLCLGVPAGPALHSSRRPHQESM
jgi:hypothetical protein